MSLKIAVQMDPIQRINIKGDSTFALLLEAQKRGHKLAYYTPDRLALLNGRLFATVESSDACATRPATTSRSMSRGALELAEFDVVLLRQDPPFDLAYVTTTHLLERIHPKTLVVNDPAQVRNAPEKMFVTEFPDLMPPTLVTRDLAEIKAFRAEHDDIVMKPLYGHGGGAVFRITRDDLNFGSLYDMFSTTFREQWVVQKFLPAVKQGDKRIIAGGRRICRRGQPHSGRRRSALQHGARRRAGGNRSDQARAGHLQAARPRLARARHDVRRHRRDRRLAHRDQRHLADRNPRREEPRRPRRRGAGLGQDRSQAETIEVAS